MFLLYNPKIELLSLYFKTKTFIPLFPPLYVNSTHLYVNSIDGQCQKQIDNFVENEKKCYLNSH